MLRLLLWLSLVLCIAACAPAVPPTPQPLAAQDFALTALDGSTVRLSDLRGRWVMINFWATWCEPCKVEMPDLQRIAAQHSDRLTLLGINMRESETEVRAFVDELELTFPMLLNPDDATITGYYVLALPVTAVISPDSNLVYRQFGPVDMEFESELAALLGA
jgi:thiol-disulfide isomerase/thioredoxin